MISKKEMLLRQQQNQPNESLADFGAARKTGKCSRSGRRLADPVSTGKTYVMFRHSGEALAYVRGADGSHRRLQHIVYHSPTGFEWGYGGSGPADLARSILADAFDRTVADKYYQEFKWAFIARLPFEGGEIKRSEIVHWLRAHGVEGVS